MMLYDLQLVFFWSELTEFFIADAGRSLFISITISNSVLFIMSVLPFAVVAIKVTTADFF